MNPADELKKIAAEIERFSAAEGIRILEQGKPVDIPSENISRLDDEGVDYRHPKGHLVGASWNLQFIHEAMDFMTDDEYDILYSFTGLPEGEYDWSFIRDAGPAEKQDMVDFVKSLPAFNKMKELGLTSATKV